MTIQKFELKKIKKEDLQHIIKWRNDSKIIKFNTQFFLLNMEYQKKWFKNITKKDSTSQMFIFKYGNHTVGIGGLIHHDCKNKSADIAIILGEPKIRGKGFGTKALQMLVDYGFKQMKLHRIGADIFEYNKISLNLFEKLDFKKELEMKDYLWRDGKWWKVYTYSKINSKN
ncbi:GNAT family N-acetyltransferase [Candidatus Nitrosopelagicus sp.]|nr:GNAT family N-acetyltransferase [Candidatus Nitrosopelagicus sp.]